MQFWLLIGVARRALPSGHYVQQKLPIHDPSRSQAALREVVLTFEIVHRLHALVFQHKRYTFSGFPQQRLIQAPVQKPRG